MARATARVYNGMLELPEKGSGHSATIAIGSTGWFDWLKLHRSFRFEGHDVVFTARQEQRPGGWYWYASRRVGRILHTLYLGRSEDLTQQRLNLVAHRLTKLPQRTPNSVLETKRQDGVLSNFLLATKLTIPPPKPDYIPRQRLVMRVQACTQHKLTLVVAPAGYGKTTLLSIWIARSSLSVTWISLGKEENDPTRFWNYVIAALERLNPDIGKHLLPLLNASQTPPLEMFLTALINTLAAISEHAVLVFDDYHLIHAAPIHTGMSFLLEHLPSYMHVVIASRTEPPFALARLRARGDVIEIGPADLHFTLDEAAAFLNGTMGLDLSTAQLSQLVTRTEGWIAGLQLAALSLQHREDMTNFIDVFSGSNRHMFDYFTEEVLQGQSEPFQDFLLQTSILDRLSGPLCDAVTGQHESTEMLRALERANLFVVPIDIQCCWYRYHHLFADLLRRRLQLVQPERLAELHRRAASWYAHHGLKHEAIEHALAATDFALAAHLLEELATTMPFSSAATMRLNWLKALPSEIVRISPRLGLFGAQTSLEISQFAGAEPWVLNTEIALSTCTDLAADERRTILGEIEAIRSTIAINLGDMAGAIDHAQCARDLLSPSDTRSRYWIAQVALNLADAHEGYHDPSAVQAMYAEAVALNHAAGNPATAITAMSSLGWVQARQGKLHEGARTLHQALRLAAESTVPLPWPSTGKAHIYLGALLYEWNDLDGSVRHLTEGIQLCQRWGHVYHLAEGLMFLAKVRAAQGKLNDGCTVLEQARRLVDETTLGVYHPIPIPKLHRLANRLAAAQAELLTACGDLDEATRWACRCGLSLTIPLDRNRTDYDTTLAHLLVALGRPNDAVKVLEELAATMEAGKWTDDVIVVLVAQAAALEATGATVQALTVLERALQHAKVGGYVRTFLDEGFRIHRLLCLAASYGRMPDYIGMLLAAFHGEPIGHEQPRPSLVEPLSKREVVVLRLLAAGLSSSLIAQHLVVAVSTVQTHIKHIYAKLDAHTRAEALAQARIYGLV